MSKVYLSAIINLNGQSKNQISNRIENTIVTGQDVVKTHLCAVRRSRHLAHSQIKSEDLFSENKLFCLTWCEA